MFSSPALILGLILIALAAAFLLLCPTAPGRPSSPPPPGEVSVSAAEGSIVTVRKVGGVTSVVVHSHWEGEDGITPPALPPDITRAREPELYAEYMSPETTATRKYEIIDLVYGLGYTLPAIPGLHEQYMKEVRESSGKKGGKSPVNLSERAGRPIKRLHIDRSVSPSDVPDMGASPSDQPQNE